MPVQLEVKGDILHKLGRLEGESERLTSFPVG
jgi:hypothetical protein